MTADQEQGGGYGFRSYYARPAMIAALLGYVTHGVPLGDFLRAVVSNDLFEAMGRADEDNLRNMPALVGFLYNECPTGCWGSPVRYNDWLAAKAQERAAAAASLNTTKEKDS